ncbi:MAG TPA: PAS domain-containing protein, partial [Urbifossiella sp.]|nr:PAS domain-containing protein [Urbifossiella sp.]
PYTSALGTRAYEYIFVPVSGADGGVEAVAGSTRDITERRQAEAEREQLLREVETERGRLAEVFRHAPSFMAVLRGPDHVFERANDRYVALAGGRELIGRPVREALPEVVGQGFIDLLDRVYRSGEAFVGVGTRVVLEPGGGRPTEERYLDFVYQPLQAAGGAVGGILVQGIDQTERKRAERDLHDREEFLRRLVESSQDCIKVLGLDGRLQSINECGMRALEVDHFRQIAGAEWVTFWDGEDRAAAARAVAEARAGRASGFVGFSPTRTGRPKWWDVVVAPIVGADAAAGRVLVVSRDVTERRQDERNNRFLADASAYLAELVDYESTLRRIANLAVGVFADWCVVDVLDDDGARRRLAVTASEAALVADPRAADATTDAGPDAVGGVPHVLRTGEPEAVADLAAVDPETSALGPDRLARLTAWGIRSYLAVPLLVRGRVAGGMTFLGTSGRHRYGPAELAVARDLAQRVATTIENAQLYRALQQQDRRKDEFLATLAHELRNPLAPVRNGVHILRAALPPGGPLADTVGMMDRQVGQMVHLIDDLMDVARVSSGKVHLRPERLDLREVVAAA